MGFGRLAVSAWVAVLVLAAGCAPTDGVASGSGARPDSLFGGAGQWTELPPAPLAARYEADGAWVAGRFVVVGGWSGQMCPPERRLRGSGGAGPARRREL
jgi:hypothetical protein